MTGARTYVSALRIGPAGKRRAKEVRLLLLRNVVLPKFGDRGEFIIEAETGTKRGSNGVRTVPMEPLAVEPVREYVRRARPAYVGDGDEPLFLTDDGRAFSREGWSGMAQRIRRRLAEEGIAFKQHRLRSTCARRLHEAGYPDLRDHGNTRLELDGDAPAIPR